MIPADKREKHIGTTFKIYASEILEVQRKNASCGYTARQFLQCSKLLHQKVKPLVATGHRASTGWALPVPR